MSDEKNVEWIICNAGGMSQKIGTIKQEFRVAFQQSPAITIEGESIHVIEKSAYDQLAAERDRYKTALEFYAENEHFQFCGGAGEPENPSGEPANWESGEGKFNVENGGVARAALGSNGT